MIKCAPMQTQEFEYDLPDELIAHEPLKQRDQSRMMCLNATKKTINHNVFSDISEKLTHKDVLVLNNTKVIKARLFATKETGAKIELFLVKSLSKNEWEVLAKPAKRIRQGDRLMIAADFDCVVQKKLDGPVVVLFNSTLPFFDALDKYGHTPTPPYIKNNQKNVSAVYQTTFAQSPGAVAAPTAGLHFTPALLQTLQQKGVEIVYVTLHVGYGTFQPITVDTVMQHRMHEEFYVVPPKTAEALNKAYGNKRIVAVGTTCVRTLEANFKDGQFHAESSSTSLFIYPGYIFNTVDVIITNFHLSKSSLMMLISAFCGLGFLKKAYALAIQKKYRFYSFGDAMMIEK